MNRALFRGLVHTLFLLLLLTACGTAERVSVNIEPELPWPELAPPSDAERFDIDRDASLLRVRVDPAGAMARMGHSHVVGGPVISGTIWRASALEKSLIDLEVISPAMQVDRPEWRAAYGMEPEIEPDTIEGTRNNLLGPQVLDAEGFPRIGIRAVSLQETPAGLEVNARIRLRGRVSEVIVPVSLTQSGEALEATGRFFVTHEALGMEPFSALGGALRVADRIELDFRLVARSSADTASG